MSEKIYTPDELAEAWKVAPKTIREMCGRGELRSFRIGRAIRISQDSVDDYMRDHQSVAKLQEPPAPRPRKRRQKYQPRSIKFD